MANNLAELGKKKLFQNLLDKLKSGKTLTNSERRQFDELSELFDESAKTTSTSNPLEVPRPIVAALFSVTPQTVQNWVDKGMPKQARGLYNLKECFDWWRVTIDGGGTEEMDAHKTRYWKEQADGKEIENAKTRGELISLSDALAEWGDRCSDLRTGLLSWSSRLPPVLEGKDVIELRLALRAATDELLDAFCRHGRFTILARSAKKPPKKSAKKRKGKKI